MKNYRVSVVLGLLAFAGGCRFEAPSDGLAQGSREAKLKDQVPPGIDAGAGSPIPCSAKVNAITGATGNVTLMVNSAALVDSYTSANGPYGGSNINSHGNVMAAGTITNNGGVINGQQFPNTPSNLPLPAIPSSAVNLPIGSPSPGNLYIDQVANSITLAPGSYVVQNMNVSYPGSVSISPVGQVTIFVTGSLNLGGNENLNGSPANLAFVVMQPGWVNVNSNGQLFGNIYAPTTGINLNSVVFGYVVGSSVVLNSGAAVHYDTGVTCPVVLGPISTTPSPSGLDPLPPPPTQVGCYVGTLNGWLQVQCSAPTTIINGFQHFDTAHDGLVSIPYNAGGIAQPAVPLVYGQVESIVTSVASETDGNSPNNPGWSIQNNTNAMNCNGTDTCLVQFVACADGVSGVTAVCIEPWRFPTGGGAAVIDNFCVGANGQTFDNGGNLIFSVNTRVGALQQGDFANVAGFAYTANGQALMAMVAQFSWVSSQDVQPVSETALPNRIPGLYAVVAPDQWGLAQGWTRVTGSLIGKVNGSQANFTNAQVLTRTAASNCPGDVSASGPTCPVQPALSATNVQYTTSAGPIVTVESNNLTVTQAAPGVIFPNRNLAVSTFLASTNVPDGGAPTASCLPGQESHLYIRDTEGDSGGVPSNVGGVPFWESPDIFIIPQGAAAPGITDVPGDFQLTAGQPYNVYLRVHNEFGCNDVNGPIDVFVDAADPDLGFANWLKVTDGADLGLYTTFGAANTLIAPAYGVGIIGPFPWTPGDGGHKCILAAISASNETKPAASATPPVLPPAYSSNQIAQRNLQIGSSCSYNISNTIPVATQTATVTKTSTVTVTSTSTSVHTLTQTSTVTVTDSATQSSTGTRTQTATATTTATATGTLTSVQTDPSHYTPVSATVTATDTANVYYLSWTRTGVATATNNRTATASSTAFSIGTKSTVATNTVTSPYNGTETKTVTGSVTASGLMTGTPSVVVTVTATSTSPTTGTSTHTYQGSGTRTLTATGSNTGNGTQSWTYHPTGTVTSTVTRTVTNTSTVTNTATTTSSHTATSTSTFTQTQTDTTTNTQTQTFTATGTKTATSTDTSLGTTADLQLGISVTPATPAPGSSSGPTISLVFSDPSGTWAAIWQGQAGLSSVTNDGTNTTVVLSSSYVALTSVPLGPAQSPAVSINITPVGGNPPTVNVSAILTDPETGAILQQNGGSCVGTQIIIPPPQ
jgi:hypothetical protein